MCQLEFALDISHTINAHKFIFDLCNKFSISIVSNRIFQYQGDKYYLTQKYRKNFVLQKFSPFFATSYI